MTTLRLPASRHAAPGELDAGVEPFYLLLSTLLNFEPSKVKLYISPFWPKMKPLIRSVNFVVSIVPPAPRATSAAEPSTEMPAKAPFFSHSRPCPR
jgi:hypothetical protein